MGMSVERGEGGDERRRRRRRRRGHEVRREEEGRGGRNTPQMHARDACERDEEGGKVSRSTRMGGRLEC